MPKIFISYRRNESKDVVGRIYDRLAGYFGKNSIFFDMETIPAGVDFREWLRDEMQSCRVLIAIIGRDWLDAIDDEGRCRIHDDNDWVRLEIESALARKIPVIPLLVNGAKLPRPEKLPESLKGLAYRQAAKARTDDFDADMTRLIREINRHLAGKSSPMLVALFIRKLSQVPKQIVVGTIAIFLLLGSLYLVRLPLLALLENTPDDAVIPIPPPVVPEPQPFDKDETMSKLISNGKNLDFEGIYLLSTDYPKVAVESLSNERTLTYNELKQKGIDEFSIGNYSSSVEIFQRIRDIARDQRAIYVDKRLPEHEAAVEALKDPQVLIFQNNAEVRRRQAEEGQTIYTIAAAVPVTGSATSIGRKMLWGIAQAQDKAVNAGGEAPSERERLAMPQLNLEVVIADDRNNPQQAEVLAQTLSQSDQNFLAIVGHYLSSSTCQAIEAGYQDNVVVISPLSTEHDLRYRCGNKNTFFRTTSSTKVEASTLIGYLEKFILEELNKDISKAKVAIFFNEEDRFSRDLSQVFESQLGAEPNSINLSSKDISETELIKLREKINNAISNSDALAVLPDGRNSGTEAFDLAIEIINNNQGKIILGSNPLYDGDVIDLINNPEDYVEKLFIASDWYQDCAPDDIVREIESYWLGEVSRDSMLSYEAVQVLIYTINNLGAEVDSNQLREALQELPAGAGAGGLLSHIFDNKTISFDGNGDRREIDPRILLTVDAEEGNPFGVYDESQCL